MRLTNVLFKKAKKKYAMVLLRSTGSDHEIVAFREKNAEKIEKLRFDPLVEKICVYKEEKKIKSSHFFCRAYA